jgi:long-chain acyl-CoA synthetase
MKTLNLGKLIDDAGQRYGQRNFVSFMQNKELVNLSFSDVVQRAREWASYFKSQGIREGDRVAFLTPKSPNQIRTFYACWWLGAIAVPISEDLGDLEMGFIIRDCNPSLILVDSSVERKVRDNAPDIPVVTFGDIPDRSCEGGALPLNLVPHDSVAALIYTSGSTGMPKGVILTHRNFYTNAESASNAFPITQKDVLISLLPYWHSFALVVEVVLPLLCGFNVIVPKDKRDFSRNIQSYQPTIILLVPRIADALLRGIKKKINESPDKVKKIFDKAIHNASRIFTAGPVLDGGMLRLAAHHSFYDPMVFRKIRARFGGQLRFLVSGGAPLDLEHQIFFKYLGIPIYQGYGLSEATPVVSTNRPDVHKLGSCGPILDWLHLENGGDYMFKDEHGSLGKDLHGELLIKGDCVMKGYWKHTDASSKTLADGWLHTGDMGYVDDDGFLFIDGRQGNMIVLFGGEKLHPEHVEDALKTSDLVTEAMVIGEGCKNVYACVNVDSELTADMSREAMLAQIRQQVKEKSAHLAPYQRPKDVLILPEFNIEDGTLTVTLKVRRHKVREKYGDQIRGFLKAAGEDVVTRDRIDLASSKVMESLGRDSNA